MEYSPSLHERALMSAQNVQNDLVYGKTNFVNNNETIASTAMNNLQNRTLLHQNIVDRMKRSIIIRRDPRVQESITLNSL